MKILHLLYDHINNPWVGGGGAKRAAILYGFLCARGHSVEMVSGKYPGCRDYEEDGIKYRFVGNDRNYALSTFSYAWAGRRYVRERAAEFDLVVEDFMPFNPLFTAGLQQRQPVILQLQSFLGREILRRYNALGIPFYFLEKYYPRQFPHRIIISEELNRFYDGGAYVISNGVEASYLEQPVEEGSYIAFMGRLDFQVKGLDLLLKAMETLPLPLKIAGDGAERDRLREQIASLPQVEWVGTVSGEDKLNFFRNARYVVVPSRSEGQNMVVLEAAALGKSCLVSDISGLSYAVKNGFGLAFKTQSASDLREKMQLLWEDGALRNRLAARGRPWMAALTWPKLAERFEAYCMNVLRTAGRMASL